MLLRNYIRRTFYGTNKNENTPPLPPKQVFSWSRSKATFDSGASDGSSPRSFVSIVSEMIHSSDTCVGAADDDAGEGRMDSESPLNSTPPIVPRLFAVGVVVFCSFVGADSCVSWTVFMLGGGWSDPRLLCVRWKHPALPLLPSSPCRWMPMQFWVGVVGADAMLGVFHTWLEEVHMVWFLFECHFQVSPSPSTSPLPFPAPPFRLPPPPAAINSYQTLGVSHSVVSLER